MTHRLPHRNAYWVEPGRLMAGEYPGHWTKEVARRRLREYLSCGASSFVDLTTPADSLEPYVDTLRAEAERLGVDVRYQRFPLPDLSVPKSANDMARILDAIDRDLGDGRLVYVHCWGGVGRTGTVVGCYLVRRGATGAEALERLAALWSTVAKFERRVACPETKTQQQYVRDWQEPMRPA